MNLCKDGSGQSPINIVPKRTVYNSSKTNVVFNWDEAESVKKILFLDFENNGGNL